jgi:dynein heavy chain
MLLMGIGGSGRTSLSKMASFICMYSVFEIEVSKNYKRSEFREGSCPTFGFSLFVWKLISACVALEDLKKLYSQAGVSNKETTFIFNDTQVVEETFLEDINNILSSGEVPNLYKPEEIEEVSSHNRTNEQVFLF